MSHEPAHRPPRSDSELQRAVLDELAWDTRLREAEVGVEADRGIITLSGSVDSWAKQQAAQEAAHRVEGVLDVANELQVNSLAEHRRTDSDIARAVRDALQWNVFVPDAQIRSTVSHGQVVLEGEVEHAAQRADAERAISRLIGVRHVTNLISLVPKAAPT
jgi:osmotically-inducible protein OsmY